ncbi:hypothetical protein [Winogradskyella aquimaris]|uniref:PH domain-containing protein n=1 Tax=Winogradskyella aquimaris TaxID=864074 RepID=A0ABU5EPR4_9FLAO|nr:hypothetical protein [Winogradskyella aquimaris]MDY2588109.1 hypothetical protein [Winogradskyella aquimaris]
MKVAYKRRHLNVNLILGLIWLVWFSLGVFGKEEPNWTDYGWIFISLMYLGLYVYQKSFKYLTVENGIINVNGPFGKKLKMTEIKQIKKFAGDYIIKTDNEELTINTQLIESSALTELNSELEKLNVEWV